MGKRVLFILIFALLFLAISIPAASQRPSRPQSSAEQIYGVHNLDTGLNYTTIQEAIDANETVNGHTILVEEGTYYERVTLDKSLSLVGENRTTTIIDGNNVGNVINVTAGYVNIAGFTIQNSGGYVYPLGSCGIYINEGSSHNNITCNVITKNYVAIGIYNSSSSTISQNDISDNSRGIRLYYGSCRNTVSHNFISGSVWGIFVDFGCNYNVVATNMISDNSRGIDLYSNNNNTISSNIVQNGNEGIGISLSSNTTLFNNSMTDNAYNFGLGGDSDPHFDNLIDVSNTVDGKPIYYLKNETNLVLDNSTGAGAVYLINCNNITVRNFALTNNMHGFVLHRTTNSMVENMVISNSYRGIFLQYSSNNTIFNVSSSNNLGGIELIGSSDNIISGSTISSNDWYGIEAGGSFNNTIFHNNFIKNWPRNMIVIYGSAYLDNNIEGNYWDDYHGTDLNHDGIGDSWYNITGGNIDHYPLMGPFHSFNASQGYTVDVISNSTISDFEYFESTSAIRMRVSNMTANQTHGFCRVCIPHALISEPYNVTVDGAEPTYWNYTLHENGTHRWIYFEYGHSTLQVVIVPEFPSPLVLPLLMILTLLAIVSKRKRLLKRTQDSRV